MDLFEHRAARDPEGVPLADRMRPERIEDIVGQRHLLGENKLLATAIRGDRVPSLVLWGPPGTGKTTIAKVIAGETRADFVPFSAALSGVPELRKLIAEAEERRRLYSRRTILFIDEIHRFNKSQQDALLPHVEKGTVVLVGATTENPSFAVNAALLSRARVFRLELLSADDIVRLLERALADRARGLGALKLTVAPDALRAIADGARGDARRALDVLEVAARHAIDARDGVLDVTTVEEALAHRTVLYDKAGTAHYDAASVFIKSMRAGNGEEALRVMNLMLEAGEDPLFILRRMVIFASEDVGNKDPQALILAVAADAAFRRVGMPEGHYPMTQLCEYLSAACAR